MNKRERPREIYALAGAAFLGLLMTAPDSHAQDTGISFADRRGELELALPAHRIGRDPWSRQGSSEPDSALFRPDYELMVALAPRDGLASREDIDVYRTRHSHHSGRNEFLSQFSHDESDSLDGRRQRFSPSLSRGEFRFGVRFRF